MDHTEFLAARDATKSAVDQLHHDYNLLTRRFNVAETSLTKTIADGESAKALIAAVRQTFTTIDGAAANSRKMFEDGSQHEL